MAWGLLTSSAVMKANRIPCDLVIIATRFQPNHALGRRLGLKVSPQSGIVVDEYMRTSEPDIFAGRLSHHQRNRRCHFQVVSSGRSGCEQRGGRVHACRYGVSSEVLRSDCA
jgi:thioredoxin reductase